MKVKAVVLSSLVWMFWMTAPVWAQQAFPYEGVVTGSNVYVRSGPNTESYPVAKLSSPDRVSVVAELSNDWLAVQPVRGCYGVISAQYIQPDATGKIGTIIGEAVLVRAAGELRTRDFDNPLGKRNRGDRVRIIGKVVGTDGKVEWYVIKPPADMRFYIAAQFVRPADGSTPADREQEQDQESSLDEEVVMVPEKSEESTAAQTKKPQSIADQPAVGAPVRQDIDALRAIRALEKELVAESAKPLNQRNYSSIKARAEQINMPRDSRFYPIYESMMQYLQEEVTIVEGTRETDQMVADVLRQAAEKSAGAAQPYQPSPAKAPKAEQFEGMVTVSALYTIADPSKTSRYVIRDPDTMSVVGYVQSSTGKVNLKNYVNQYVRIEGKEVYDDSISMKILEVDTVTPMEPPATPARQPEPVEEPAPTPAEPEAAAPKAAEPEEPAAPVKKPAPVVVATPKPAEPQPEPSLTEATEPELEEPAPEEVATPKAAKTEPLAPVVPEAVTLDEEPAPAEIAQPEPEESESAEPEPVAKTPDEPQPEEVASVEPEADTEPVSAQPIAPKKAAPVDVEPMKIEAASVAPADVEDADLPQAVKASSSRTKASIKTPADESLPAEEETEPEMKTFEVQATQGEVEVEWD